MIGERGKEKSSAIWVDLGKMGYRECHDWQCRIHTARRERIVEDCLILVEHPEVFTLGRRGGRENVLVSESMLAQRNIECVQVERGGDITYHGPGQLVGYPIFEVTGVSRGVADFVHKLEEVMLGVLEGCGLTGRRREINHGAWIGDEKVGFIGIAIRRGVSFHGFSLNVSPDLSAFSMINPCGLTETRITSIADKCGGRISMAAAKDLVIRQFSTVFQLKMKIVSIEEIIDKQGSIK